MIAVVVLFAAATWTRFYFMMSMGERVVTDLRRAVFDHLLRLEPAFFEAARTGEVISRLTNDATLLQQVIGYGLSMFVRNGLMMVGAAVMLFVTSWKLALLVLVGAGDAAADPAARPARAPPVAPEPGPRRRRLGLRRRGAARDPHRAGLRARGRGPRDLRAPRRSGLPRRRARIRHKAFLIASVILIAFSAVGIILWIGGHDVMAGRLTAGELSAFVFYAAVVATGAGTVAEVWGELQRAAGATERLMELLDTPPRIVPPPARSCAAAPGTGSSSTTSLRLSGAPESAALAASRSRGARRARRAGRTLGRRQVHRVRAAAALLRSAARARCAHRRRGLARMDPRGARRWSRWCRRSR